MFYRHALLLLLPCTWFFPPNVFAQDQRIADSLAPIYLQDTLPLAKKLSLLSQLAFNEINDVKKGLAYAEELIRLAEQSGNESYQRDGYFQKGTKKRLLSQHAEALAAFIKSAEIARKTHFQKGEGEAYGGIADIYAESNNLPNAIPYYNKAITTLREAQPRNYLDSTNFASILSNAGDAYRQIRRYDSALLFSNEAKELFNRLKNPILEAYTLGNIGMIYVETGRDDQGERNLQKAIAVLEKQQHFYPVCVYLLSLADVNLHKGDLKAAFDNAAKSLHLAEQNDLNAQIRDAHLKLSQLNEKAGNPAEALTHYKQFIVYRDSISNNDVERKMTALRHNFDMAQKQSEMDALNKEKQAENKLTLALAAILGLTIFVLAVLFRSNRIKQKAYRTLNLQKLETDRQKAKAENALLELQVTQRQLVHSAKMASLGELTAGIAHEIQNPLNFVNNFSEVSVELLDELKEGIFSRKTDTEKTEAIELFNNLTDNLRKVRDHGKRADSIVKGMLQHSTATTGKKEPTNLNALADEYLRLSFHGLRAKDKTFTANFTTNFDENIGLLDLVPQDIGRVLLNFYNNAFYSVNEKRKQGKSNDEPLVSVATKRLGGKVILSVKDNGTGIPPALLDKVFQPFFTTKPAGQGTGLGLSLSYDIIKAHGGELTVNTKEGVFAEFVIELPAENMQPNIVPTTNTATTVNGQSS